MRLVSLIILTFSFSSYACNYALEIGGLEPTISNLAEEISRDCTMELSKSDACDCADNHVNKTNTNKNQSKLRSKALSRAIESSQIALFSINQDIAALGNNAQFANNSNLGKTCSPDNTLDVSCLKNNKLSSDDKKLILKLSNQFKNEIEQGFDSTKKFLDKELLVKNKLKSQKTCQPGISDSALYKMNFNKSQADLAVLLSSIQSSPNPHAKNSKNLIDFIFFNIKDTQLRVNTIESLSSNPLTRTILTSPEIFQQFKNNQFDINNLTKILDSEQVVRYTEKQLEERCNKVKDNFEEIFCSETEQIYPRNYDEFSNILLDTYDTDNANDLMESNQEIALYCSKPDSFFDGISITEKSTQTLPLFLKNKESLETVSNQYYQNNIIAPHNLLCEQLKNTKPAELSLKIKEMGCETSMSQDCTFMSTMEAVYGDKLNKPGATFEQVFAEQQKEKSILVKSYLGEELTKPEIAQAAEATEQAAKREEAANATGLGKAKNALGKIFKAPKKDGLSASDRANNRRARSGKGIGRKPASREKTQQEMIKENMDKVYDRIARQISQGNERDMQEMRKDLAYAQGQLNGMDSTDSPMTNTMRKAMSGKHLGYDKMKFGSSEPSRDESGLAAEPVYSNYTDPTGSPVGDSDSPESKVAGDWNRALGDRESRRKAAASGGASFDSLVANAIDGSDEIVVGQDSVTPIETDQKLSELSSVLSISEFEVLFQKFVEKGFNADKKLNDIIKGASSKSFLLVNRNRKELIKVKRIVDREGSVKFLVEDLARVVNRNPSSASSPTRKSLYNQLRRTFPTF
jgi:hypothetical protein